MYTQSDPIADLYHTLPFDHELYPDKGDLDIEGVLDSEFFFS
jgi:DNA-directed RNA polymerase